MPEDETKNRIEKAKSQYWQKTWNKFKLIMKDVGIDIPGSSLDISSNKLEENVNILWNMKSEHRKIALSILVALCDCMIWWTQRYKP
jgi:hypothetical protein